MQEVKYNNNLVKNIHIVFSTKNIELYFFYSVSLKLISIYVHAHTFS